MSSGLRIALATCSGLSDREVDDRPLFAALTTLGVEALPVVWDDRRVDWSSFDACLIRTTWDYAERREEFVDWAERVATATRLFNDARTVRWNTRKDYLTDLESSGAPVAPSIWLERGSRADVAALMRERQWGRGFLKPLIGATARETLRFSVEPRADWAGVREAQIHVARLLPHEGLILQPYYASVESLGEISAIFIGGDYTHAVRKIPVPGDYRVQDDLGATDEPYPIPADELELVRRIVGLVDGQLLYARVDFLYDDEGRPRLNELELVEPSLFFRHGPESAEQLARALVRAARR